MISSPNAYFTAEEAKATGAEPVFTIKIFPYYLNAALAAGTGTWTDCAFVAPNKIEVDWQASSASYTSPEIVGNNEVWPVNATVTWTGNNTGYFCAVQYRTATSSAALAVTGWSSLTSGGSYDLYQYYQWRVVWTGIRSFAFDVDSPLEPTAAYAVDAYDPNDPWQSYATDGVELIAYLEAFTLAGEFEIPQSDIIDAGELTLDAPSDFGEIVAGDHAVTLLNPSADPNNLYREGRYSPGHANFVFADEDDWYLKNIAVYLGYRRAGTDIVDSVLMYEGVILTWGPVIHAISEDGQLQEHTVEIYSRNRISYLLDVQIGKPNDDGTPNPVVYGVNFGQADQVAGEMVGNPTKSAFFEGNTTAEWDHTYTDGGGDINIVTDNPATGSYCCQFTTSGLAGDYAYGVMDLPASSDFVFLSFQIKFNAYPTEPHYGTNLIKIDGGGSYSIYFSVSDGGRVVYYDGAFATEETDWYVDEFAGSWRTVAFGIVDNVAAKLWVDGNEVWSYDGKAGSWGAVEIGLKCDNAEVWDISIDDVKVHNTWYPEMYQLSGYPYASIDAVYIDGALRIQSAKSGVVSRIIAGRKPDPANIDLLPEYGVVRFTDFDDLPSGDVMLRAVKNTTQHPVDIVEAVLGLANCSDYVDAASFAAAKADLPDDIISVYAEEMTAGDLLREIARSCLILMWMDQDVFKVKAYLGTAPVSSVLTLDASAIADITEEVDMESLKTEVNAKYGWYDKNNRLFYKATDDTLNAKIGDLTESIDLSWGQVVVCESQAVAKAKADALLAQKSGGVSRLTMRGPLSWARLEIGDDVKIDVPFIRENEIYTVFSKTVRCQPPYGVEITVLKFLGES